jgi:tetratricopeptide (TPR) repeat protein
MEKRGFLHVGILGWMLCVTLTCAPPPAFPAPPAAAPGRAEALAKLKHPDPAARAEAMLWLAERGGMADQPLLLARLRDSDEALRALAEQALWHLWSRSGDAQTDRLLAEGIAQMQSARLAQAIATFGEVIRRRPGFAEGWNKRATAHYLAGDFARSLADCDEVVKRNPSHFGALSGYGQIHFRLERYELAIEYWRRALRVNPNMPGVEANIESAEERLRERRARSI